MDDLCKEEKENGNRHLNDQFLINAHGVCDLNLKHPQKHNEI